MAKTTSKNLADHIVNLNINGLRGRMLRLPTKKRNREILLIYGQHSNLERFFGLAEALNDYGAVTMPDLPGFGGMQSFYNLGITPTIDNLADYLATFIKFRYKHRRLTIVGVSFGFTIVARMLQKYPDLASKVDLVVSVMGFVHYGDFVLKKPRYYLIRYGSMIFTLPPPAWFVQNILFQRRLLSLVLSFTSKRNQKLSKAKQQQLDKRIESEVNLWRQNDVRTYMKTTSEMLRVNLCSKQVKVPAYHITLRSDHYLDNRTAEQHLRVIFNDLTVLPSKLQTMSLTSIASSKEVLSFMPAKLKTLLRST